MKAGVDVYFDDGGETGERVGAGVGGDRDRVEGRGREESGGKG